MIVLQIVLLIIWFGIVPILLGSLFTGLKKEDGGSLMLSYCSGLIVMLAACQLVTVPLIFLRKGMTSVLFLYGGIVALLCLVSLLFNRKQIVKQVKKAWETMRHNPWTIWVTVVLILFQTFVLTTQQHIDDDDSFYVGMAAAAVETEGLYAVDPYTGEAYEELPSRYVLSPFPIFNAASSMITKTHPAAMAHTVFPLVFIPFAYMIYGLLGIRFFKENRWAVGAFLILASMVTMFSGYSVYTEGMFLLVRIWQGKAVLAGALLPAVYEYGFRAFQNKGKLTDYLMVFALMLACSLVSSMGIMLGAIALGITGFTCAFRERRIRILLYGVLCCIPNLVYAAMYLVIK